MKKQLLSLLCLCLATASLAQLDSVIYGIARSPAVGSNPATIFLARISPTTGVVTNISPISQATIEEMGNRTIDNKTKTFYFMSQTFGMSNIVGLSLASGTITTNQVISNTYGQYFSQMQYHCADSTIYGLARGLSNPSNPTSGYVYLARINPATGSVTNISPNSVASSFLLPSATIDTRNKIYYFSPGNTITGLDLATGTVVSAATMTNTNASFFNEMIYNRGDSTIYGLARSAPSVSSTAAGSVYLARINPATGVVTNISAASVATAINVYNASIDPFQKIYYFVDGALQIKGLSLITGNIVSVQTVTNAGAQYFDNMDFCFNSCSQKAYAPSPPISAFTVAPNTKCSGKPVPFTDQSINNPGSWSWSVTPAPGVVISSASAQNPTITFGSAGVYTVSVVASNTVGNGNTFTQTVTISATPTLVVSPSSALVCPGSNVSFTASGAASYNWSNGGGSSPATSYLPIGPSSYTVTGFNNGCTSNATVSANILPSPTISISGTTSICSGSSVSFLASGATSYTWSNGSFVPGIVVAPGTSTVYFVNGTSPAGCTGSSSIALSVNPRPVLSISGTSAVCSGQSASLSAAGAGSYTWNTGSQAFTLVSAPATSTVYTVTGTDANGCTGSKSFTVKVNPAPLVSVASNHSLICSGSSQAVLLSASGAGAYAWQPGTLSGISVTVMPLSTTVYTCTGTDANGCSNLAMFTVSVSLCEGLEKSLSIDNTVYTLFPNPTSGRLNIRASGNSAPGLKLEVNDAAGRIVLSQNVEQGADPALSSVDLSSLPAGIYFVKLWAQGRDSQKVLIIKE